MTNGSRDDFQESEKSNFGSHLVEKLREIEKFLKIFKKAEVVMTSKNQHFGKIKTGKMPVNVVAGVRLELTTFGL